MNQKGYPTHLLDIKASFIRLLEARGLGGDMRVRRQLELVFLNFGYRFTGAEADFASYLIPLLAHSPAEAELVKELWAQALNDIKTTPPIEGAVIKDDGKSFSEKLREHFRTRYPRYLLGLCSALLLAGAYILWRVAHLTPPLIQISNISVGNPEAGDTLRLLAKGHEDCKGCTYNWILDSAAIQSGVVLLPSEQDTLASFLTPQSGTVSIMLTTKRKLLWRTLQLTDTLPQTIFCAGKPRFGRLPQSTDGFTCLFRVATLDTHTDSSAYRCHWNFGDGETSALFFAKHVYSKTGTFTVTVNVTDSLHPDCPWTNTETVRIDTTTTMAKLPEVKPIPPRYVSHFRLSGWGVAMGALLTGVFVLLFVLGKRLSQREKEKLLRQQMREPESGPVSIPWPDRDNLIEWNNDLRYAARMMAGREESSRTQINLNASVMETARASGFGIILEKPFQNPVQWVILLDNQELNLFQYRLFRYWAMQLEKHGVDVQLYAYHGHPEWCWRPGDTNLVSLRQLASRHAGGRLVIVTRGSVLLDQHYYKLRVSLSEELKQWPNRYLLTPNDARSWGKSEAALAQFFTLVSAESAALNDVFGQAPQKLAGFEAWKQKMRKHSLRYAPWPAQGQEEETLLRQVERTYGKDHLITKWFAGIFVFDQPVWEQAMETGGSYGPHLAWDDCLHLSRLPALDAEVWPLHQEQGIVQNPHPPADKDPFLTGVLASERVMQEAQKALKQRGQTASYAAAWLEQELSVASYRLNPHNKEAKEAVSFLTRFRNLRIILPRPPQWRDWPRPLIAGVVTAVVSALLFFGGSFITIQPHLHDAEDAETLFLHGLSGHLAPFREVTDSTTMGLDSLELVFNRLQKRYMAARAAYMAKDFTEAEDSFLALQFPSILPLNFEDPTLPLSSAKFDTLRAHCVNGAGLSLFYSGDRVSAENHLRLLVSIYQPDYFRHWAERPNLYTLIWGTDTTESTLRVQVRDPQNNPIAAAHIVLRIRSDLIFTESSDKDGNAIFNLSPALRTELAAGQIKLEVSKESFRYFTTALKTGDEIVPVQLVSISAPPPSPYLEITLIDGKGNPLPQYRFLLDAVAHTSGPYGKMRIEFPNNVEGDVLNLSVPEKKLSMETLRLSDSYIVSVTDPPIIYEGLLLSWDGKTPVSFTDIFVNDLPVRTGEDGKFSLRLDADVFNNTIKVVAPQYKLQNDEGDLPGPGVFILLEPEKKMSDFESTLDSVVEGVSHFISKTDLIFKEVVIKNNYMVVKYNIKKPGATRIRMYDDKQNLLWRGQFLDNEKGDQEIYLRLDRLTPGKTYNFELEFRSQIQFFSYTVPKL